MRYERSIEDIDTGSAARMFNVSGSAAHTTATPAIPTATSVKNTDRQPNPVCNTPPAIGASTGASAITAAIIDNSRPACEPE